MDSDKHLRLLSLITTTLLSLLPTPTTATHGICAVFAFGDSILDPGNNNGLPSVCRSNHLPYGVDFAGGVSSGRFTNGKLPLDFVVSALGIKEVLPAYLDQGMTDEELLTGASFASSCSGLDDLTAATFGVLPMGKQVENFQEAFERMRGNVGQKKAGEILERSLFMIGSGSNDMLITYYSLHLRPIYSVPDYHAFLLSNLDSTIKTLVGLGAVRLAVVGLPPVGCLPFQVTAKSLTPGDHPIKGACLEEHNLECEAYNNKLQSLITRLQATLSKAKLAYVDIYTPMMDMINTPSNYGLETINEGCCGIGGAEFGPLCNSDVSMCKDPSKYLFWDAAHPTEVVYEIVAKQFIHNVLPGLRID